MPSRCPPRDALAEMLPGLSGHPVSGIVLTVSPPASLSAWCRSPQTCRPAVLGGQTIYNGKTLGESRGSSALPLVLPSSSSAARRKFAFCPHPDVTCLSPAGHPLGQDLCRAAAGPRREPQARSAGPSMAHVPLHDGIRTLTKGHILVGLFCHSIRSNFLSSLFISFHVR